MKNLMIFIVLFSAASAGFAQVRTFKWSYDVCEYQSSYDAKKYNLAELQDTLKLLNINGTPLNFDATPFDINKVEELNINELEQEYATKKREIENLKLIKSAYFGKLREDKLRELEQVYRLSKVTAEAHKNPQVLKDFSFAQSCINEYAEPLITGGDSLLSTWLTVNRESRKNNASPENIRKIYERQFNSPDKFRYARNEVMTFGWWNCANNFIEYVQDNGQAEKEFKKLFTRTKTVYCDEP